jgi:hypothetical protein
VGVGDRTLANGKHIRSALAQIDRSGQSRSTGADHEY